MFIEYKTNIMLVCIHLIIILHLMLPFQTMFRANTKTFTTSILIKCLKKKFKKSKNIHIFNKCK